MNLLITKNVPRFNFCAETEGSNRLPDKTNEIGKKILLVGASLNENYKNLIFVKFYKS